MQGGGRRTEEDGVDVNLSAAAGKQIDEWVGTYCSLIQNENIKNKYCETAACHDEQVTFFCWIFNFIC